MAKFPIGWADAMRGAKPDANKSGAAAIDIEVRAGRKPRIELACLSILHYLPSGKQSARPWRACGVEKWINLNGLIEQPTRCLFVTGEPVLLSIASSDWVPRLGCSCNFGVLC